MSDKTFYVTTPIYYVNARPHIGHAYTTIVADVLARRHRLLGEETFFLTGTDEHGQKIERSAAAAGIPPQQFADQVSKSFSDLWQRMGITHNAYIRTTDPKHKQGVQHLFRKLYENGFIKLGRYTGAYCVSDEAFVDAPVGTPCPDCGRLLESVTEENFFFKLSAFQKPLLDLIESNTLAITPESRRNEVLSFLRGPLAILERDGSYSFNVRKQQPFGSQSDMLAQAEIWTVDKPSKSAAGHDFIEGVLQDLSISRSSFTWGISVPEDVQRAAGATQNHVIYVWLDALANYITALGYGSNDETLFKKFWPANIHLVGKEIIRFHCVYWPAFLLALNPAYKTANAYAPNPDSVEAPNLNPVILSEGRSPQPKDPEGADPTTTANTFSTTTSPTQLTFDQHKTWAEKWLPKAVTAHGWLLFEESKMSKSRGNIVRTETILEAFGTLCPPPIASKETNLNSPASALKGTGFSPSANLSPNDAALAAEGIFTEPQPFPESTDRRGTASAVPETTSTENGALAPEVRLATQHDRDLFASDILRYFLLREIPFGQDGSFSFDAMITRYNADLANGLGNLASRTLKMIDLYFNGIIPEATEISLQYGAAEIIPDAVEDALIASLERFEFSAFLEGIARIVAATDVMLTTNRPWKERENEFATTLNRQFSLSVAAAVVQRLAMLVYPVIPSAAARIWAQLGLGSIEEAATRGDLRNLDWADGLSNTKLGPLSPIFPRADKGLAQIMTDMENPTPADTTPADPAAIPPTLDTTVVTAPPATGNGQPTTENRELRTENPPPATDNAPPAISIDDFIKVELRVAEIKLAERIPKADKLLRLEVDLGELGQRQILSGIAEHYAPEDLIGRRIIVITNLAPRKMRGLESHGMLLAASEEGGKPFLATVPEGVPVGTRLK